MDITVERRNKTVEALGEWRELVTNDSKMQQGIEGSSVSMN